MTPEQAQEVARLRERDVSPKQIARKLGLRPAEVNEQIRKQAKQLAIARGATDTLAPLEACWINTNAYECLLNPEANLSKEERENLDSGLAIVMVVRQPKYNQYDVCNYLVDYWCLGIKDAMGPQKMKERTYQAFLDKTYEAFEGDYHPITLEQAQTIIYSALDYAETLGFKPHRDFETAQAHLGDRLSKQTIECGRNGQPCYFSGPYDNADHIMETLLNSVGEGNFDYVTDISNLE